MLDYFLSMTDLFDRSKSFDEIKEPLFHGVNYMHMTISMKILAFTHDRFINPAP